MKQVIFVFTLIMGISVSVMAQTSPGTKKAKHKTELKAHQCTEACSKSGECVFTHGEKGHSCTEACKVASDTPGKMETIEHSCNQACKNGTHTYQHGEKGHMCTEACKRKCNN